ncbi:hypothetical protein GCM10027199_08980 [Amycolatopsis magusensis]
MVLKVPGAGGHPHGERKATPARRAAGDLLDFNEDTGAMNTTAELTDLHAQLNRALHA